MIRSFLEYVEIRTKITSLFVFLMSVAYLHYVGTPVDWRLTLLFFAGMFLFDLAVTAINNYIDSKTNGQALPFSRGVARWVIYGLLFAGGFCGLYLAYLTDAVVLLAGGLCFLCGILYTYGPLPISRLPLGEIFSGLFYGLMIPFLLFYINMQEGWLVDLSLSWQEVSLNVRVWPALTLALLAAAPTCTTANIMFANNICDLERDVRVKRHTLPYYLGVQRSLRLFAGIYYGVYGVQFLLVCLRILHPVCLLILVTLPLVRRNIQKFRGEQNKETTFLCAIKNYIIIMGAQVLLIFLSAVIF